MPVEDAMPEKDTTVILPASPTAPERLVSIESQSEFDLFTGERQERLFLKLYVAARTSGLLAAISDRDWKNLCVLATYMDATGFCFPSQAELARAMGCSRQMVSERVNSLARFRFQDQPVLVIANEKHKTNGRFSHNGYRVLPLASLGIFDGVGESGTTERKKQGPKPTVSRKPDTVDATVSSATGTVQLDTNKNQSFVNEISLSNIRKSTRSIHKNVDNAASQPVTPSHTASQDRDAASRRIDAALDPRGTETHARILDTESVGQVLTRGRGRPRKERDPDREPIRAFVEDFAREFNDQASLPTSTSRAVNLYRQAGVSLDTFLGRLYEARSIVKDRSASIRKQVDGDGWPAKNKMPYFFSVVEDLLGLRAERDEASPRDEHAG
jgi:hypothetical protein